MEKHISYIKGALIIMLRNLEEGSRDQRSKRQVLVPIAEIPVIRLTRYRFKLKDKNKLRVNLKHIGHYTLLWIAYIDNTYNIYRALKDKNRKYLIRIYQAPKEKRFRNAKYIYRQHLVKVQG